MIFFLHFREFSVHERLLSEKQLKHGRVISAPPAGARPGFRLSLAQLKRKIIINTILVHYNDDK